MIFRMYLGMTDSSIFVSYGGASSLQTVSACTLALTYQLYVMVHW